MQPLLRWKSNKYYITCVWMCSLWYPACNTHVPYCHLWPASFYTIFPHYGINGTILEKELLNVKSVLWVSVRYLFCIFCVRLFTEREKFFEEQCLCMCVCVCVFERMYIFVGRGSSVRIVTCFDLNGPDIESRWGRDFSLQSIPALRPTQSLIQWV